MGLKLRLNLFRDTTVDAVLGAYISFYEKRARPLRPSGDESQRIDFHDADNGWVVVNLDGGWEWSERRDAQSLVSQRLQCAGFLVFVFDGDYWGYEFFDRGVRLDHFIQDSAADASFFPGQDCRGNSQLIAERLPFLHVDELTPYLVRKTDWVIPEGANVPARSGDEFSRFDECAVVDFLRMLGVRVKMQENFVQIVSRTAYSRFKV